MADYEALTALIDVAGLKKEGKVRILLLDIKLVQVLLMILVDVK